METPEEFGRLQSSLDPDDVDLLDEAEKKALRAKRRLELQREQVRKAQDQHVHQRNQALRELNDAFQQADREAVADIEQAAQRVLDLINSRTELRNQWAKARGERVGIPSDGTGPLAARLRDWLRGRKPKPTDTRVQHLAREATERSDRQHRRQQAAAWKPASKSGRRRPVRI